MEGFELSLESVQSAERDALNSICTSGLLGLLCRPRDLAASPASSSVDAKCLLSGITEEFPCVVGAACLNGLVESTAMRSPDVFPKLRVDRLHSSDVGRTDSRYLWLKRIAGNGAHDDVVIARPGLLLSVERDHTVGVQSIVNVSAFEFAASGGDGLKPDHIVSSPQCQQPAKML